MNHYERLAHAFVALADTLVADYDVVELTQQLVDDSLSLLPVVAAGIVLSDPNGALHVLASSSEQSRLLEMLQLEVDDGPCVVAYRTGQAVFVNDLRSDRSRWQVFAERSIEYNFHAVAALPLRLRDERIGALNLFLTELGPLPAADIGVAQALADVATIGILHNRIWNRSELINQQLQTALNSRVVIEQAKGVLAERGHIDMVYAFNLLRVHARRTHQRLVDLARAVIDGADTTEILRPVLP